jgi:4-carboxymuconolactone decarboxylase
MDLPHFIIVGLAATAATVGYASDRLPTIPPEQYTAEQKQAAADFEAARRTPVFGPFEPLLRSPQMMSPARAMATTCATNPLSGIP